MTTPTGRTSGVGPSADGEGLISRGRYRRWLVMAVASVFVVAVVPLLIMSSITYRQYQETFRNELTRPMLRFASAGKQALESFLGERLAALALITREAPYDRLRDQASLDSLLRNLRQSVGGIVDLGLIDQDGMQITYAGPYDLAGRNYSEHEWFQQVSSRGSFVSDVFLGYRNRPHIALAVERDSEAARHYVLRATVETDVFHLLMRPRTSPRPEQGSSCRRCHSLGVPQFADAFVINRDGVLQTPSRFYGDVLAPAPLPPLPHSAEAELIELADERGQALIASYAEIEDSPFTLVQLSPLDALHAGWLTLRRDLLLFPAISSIIILVVVVVGASYVINRAREADLKRAALYHKMEYQNKLAAIGRLGAGVAHEINNPLAIITEKSGLLKDLLTLSGELPPRDKLIGLVDSVLKSADRCGGITHRLLGFAKHMDVRRETVNLDVLLREVLEFLEKEASYRDVRVTFDFPDDPPAIVGDRGQLQQVFLNIVNNAFAAVERGGNIKIGLSASGNETVSVSVADDGVGIPDEQLKQIFDPFFTTKKGGGTGLGLSITYGIIQKMRGQIDVRSTVGKGTTFTVTLPINQESR